MRSPRPGALRRMFLQPFVVLPLVALLALGGWAFLRPQDDADATATTPAATEQLVDATTGSMALTVSADGTIAAAETDDLSFTSSGTVTAVNVEAGDTVQAGDVLATIDSAELAAAVTDAEATVAAAEASLADDTAAGASDAQLVADRSSLDSAIDKLTNANEALDGADLVATFDGTVATVDLTVGEELGTGGTGGTDRTGTESGSGQSAGTLGAGSTDAQGGTATTATTSSTQIQVVSTDLYTVDLGFDAADVAELLAGQDATIALSTSTSTTARGFPGGGFPGAAGGRAGPTAGQAEQGAGGASGADGTDATTGADATTGRTVVEDGPTGLVLEVGKVADASSGVATYPVTVAFADSSGDFNPGATVTVTITYAEKADAIQVPTRAVTTSGGAATVTVSTDGVAGGATETRTVTTGLTSGIMTEITSGLAAGDQVVLATPARPGATADATAGGGGAPIGAGAGSRDAVAPGAGS